MCGTSTAGAGVVDGAGAAAVLGTDAMGIAESGGVRGAGRGAEREENLAAISLLRAIAAWRATSSTLVGAVAR